VSSNSSPVSIPELPLYNVRIFWANFPSVDWRSIIIDRIVRTFGDDAEAGILYSDTKRRNNKEWQQCDACIYRAAENIPNMIIYKSTTSDRWVVELEWEPIGAWVVFIYIFKMWFYSLRVCVFMCLIMCGECRDSQCLLSFLFYLLLFDDDSSCLLQCLLLFSILIWISIIVARKKLKTTSNT